MAYLVLARKYRPQTFKEFIGQEAIATTLAHSIEADRVAHAYLFCGPRGVGKTSMARVFSKALNCVRGPTVNPCGKCDICRSIASGEDVDIIEIDGASNRGIDEVREIRQNARYVPNRARYKIYIIDEVHMLTEPAFNALLKTLEEPPGHVKFILATTAPAKLPETIHSRLQRFTFRRVDTKTLAAHLQEVCGKEKVSVGPDVLALIAREARGSVRDALSTLDQALAFCGGEVTLERVAACLGAVGDEELLQVIDAMAAGDVPQVLRAADALLQRGVDIGELLRQLASLARDMLVARQCGPDADLLGRPKDSADMIARRAEDFQPDALIYMIQVLSEAHRRTRDDVDARLVLEMTLARLCRRQDMAPVQQLLDRLAEMELRLSELSPQGAPSSPAPLSGPAPQPGSAGGSGVEEEAQDYVGEQQAAPAAAPPLKRDGADIWQQALALVRRQASWGYVHLAGGTLRFAPDGTATISFPSDSEASFREAQNAQVRGAVESALEEVLGRPVRVLFELAGERPSTEADVAAVTKDPLIRAAMRLFDARVLRVEQEASDVEPPPDEPSTVE